MFCVVLEAVDSFPANDAMTGTAGVVLAGGAGRRLGGNKATHSFLGRPLVEHVIGRTRGQVDKLWLSTADASEGLLRFGLPIIKDPAGQADRGPLAGIVATLGVAAANGFDRVAVFPCDALFVPRDLVQRMAELMDTTGASGVVVETSRGLQPTFSLWPMSARTVAAAALTAGRLRLHTLCRELRMAVIDFRAESWEDQCLNVNTPSDLEKAEGIGLASTPPAMDNAEVLGERNDSA